MAAASGSRLRIIELSQPFGASGIFGETTVLKSEADAFYGSFSGGYETLTVSSFGGSLHFLPEACLAGRMVQLHAFKTMRFGNDVVLAAFEQCTITAFELVVEALKFEGDAGKVTLRCNKLTLLVKRGQGETPAQRLFREHAPAGVKIETKVI